MSRKFTIHVHSDFTELWRYNTAAMCGGFDGAGERVGFVSAESTVAPVGANLKAAPDDAPRDRDLTLTTAACERITAYVYLIPNTLPLSREIDDCRPFPLHVWVTANDGEVLYDVVHKVNQWSGCSIEIRLPQAKPVREV